MNEEVCILANHLRLDKVVRQEGQVEDVAWNEILNQDGGRESSYLHGEKSTALLKDTHTAPLRDLSSQHIESMNECWQVNTLSHPK